MQSGSAPINRRRKLLEWFRRNQLTADRIDTSFGGHRRQVRAGRITGLAWLVILVSRLFDLFQGNYSDALIFLGVTTLAAFVGVYVYGFFRTFFQPTVTWRTWAVIILLAGLASGMSLELGSTQLITMIFVVTAASCSLPEAVAACVLGAISILAAIVAALTGATISDIASLLFELILIGIALIFLRRLIRTNSELRLAREEIARLAVAEERLRFARDLHDLLGHSLSMIALKSELAGRLIENDPARAAVEVHEIEQVTREALREVRDAVSGYRRPALDAELAGARAALDAAGIDCEIVNRAGQLDPEIEATLGWVVREGVTNVIRHSGGHACSIHVTHEGQHINLTMWDDGRGMMTPLPDERGRTGAGIAGLRERLTAEHGELRIESPLGGGFRLTAIIPAIGMLIDDVQPGSSAPVRRLTLDAST